MMSTIRTLPPLLASLGLALFLTLSAAEMSQAQHEHIKHAPWSPFFSVFGMIYAIISGFLMVNVLGRHSDLSDAVEGELNAVEDLRDFLIYVDGHGESIASVNSE